MLFDEAVQVERPDTVLSEVCVIKGTTCCFALCIEENFNTDMHADVEELIWFKLGMMIDTTKFYILILVYVTLI